MIWDRHSHEEVDRHATDTPDPRLHVAEANVQVLADASLGDLAGDVHVEQVVLANLDVLAAVEELVWRWHVLVEDLDGDRRQGWVGDPCSVLVSAILVPKDIRQCPRAEI